MNIEFNADGNLKVSDDVIKRKEKQIEKEERDRKVKPQLENPFFRKMIFEKYHSKCFHCHSDQNSFRTNEDGKKIKRKLTIHHRNYDWYCPYENEPNYDCKNCYLTKKEIFNKCIDNCILLCFNCHSSVHWKSEHKTGKWIIKE